MPILIVDDRQYPLRPGTNVLGGIGPESVDIAELISLPRVGTITVAQNGPAILQRLSPKVVIRLNGEPLGASPRELVEGAQIEIGGLRIRYSEAAVSEPASAERTPGGTSRAPKASELATEVLPAVSAPGRPARLIALATGTTIRIVAREMIIGRSEECDVVLTGKGLSRRHAVIRAEGAGYIITDESTNGTFVNGELVGESRPLQPGDILAFGEEQFRFELIEAAGRNAAATMLVPEMQRPALAELTERSGAKRVHRVERLVCTIGRGAHNDVHLDHESVSTSHATLLLKGDLWYLTDLRSANGTYVDGFRIAAERALSPGCTIRMGKIEMVFRPARGGAAAGNGTQPVGGLLQKLAQVLSPHRD